MSGLSRDQEDGVVAADRAGDLGKLGDVEGASDRHRVAGRGTQDQQVARRLEAAHEAERLAQAGDRVDGLLGRQRVDHVAAAPHAHGAEPIEVARDGRLGDVDLLRREQLDELALRRDLTAVEDRGDYLMACGHYA